MYFKRWIITYSPCLQKSLLQNVNAFMKREREWNYIRQHPQFMQKKLRQEAQKKKKKLLLRIFKLKIINLLGKQWSENLRIHYSNLRRALYQMIAAEKYRVYQKKSLKVIRVHPILYIFRRKWSLTGNTFLGQITIYGMAKMSIGHPDLIKSSYPKIVKGFHPKSAFLLPSIFLMVKMAFFVNC